MRRAIGGAILAACLMSGVAAAEEPSLLPRPASDTAAAGSFTVSSAIFKISAVSHRVFPRAIHVTTSTSLAVSLISETEGELKLVAMIFSWA